MSIEEITKEIEKDLKEIREKIEPTIEKICDNYCKYPKICETEEQLMEKCDECPFNDLI